MLQSVTLINFCWNVCSEHYFISVTDFLKWHLIQLDLVALILICHEYWHGPVLPLWLELETVKPKLCKEWLMELAMGNSVVRCPATIFSQAGYNVKRCRRNTVALLMMLYDEMMVTRWHRTSKVVPVLSLQSSYSKKNHVFSCSTLIVFRALYCSLIKAA